MLAFFIPSFSSFLSLPFAPFLLTSISANNTAQSILTDTIQRSRHNLLNNLGLCTDWIFFYLQINIGTIHPSTHGLLRIIAFHNTEIIKWCQSEIGFLHRGAERLIEYRSYNQSIPYFDRFDYVAFLAQEEIYCFANEKLLNCWISKYSSVIRTIFCEITRILNGVLAITTHAIDIGTFTPFL